MYKDSLIIESFTSAVFFNLNFIASWIKKQIQDFLNNIIWHKSKSVIQHVQLRQRATELLYLYLELGIGGLQLQSTVKHQLMYSLQKKNTPLDVCFNVKVFSNLMLI